MKFCGKFKGCCRETIVSSKGVLEIEYPSEIKIKNVNCSQKTAYLIEVKEQTGEYKNLAFMEKDENPILRSITQDGNGITSTYYEGKYLIHQVSFVKESCKNEKQWFVKYYKMKQC
jgi:hypothetical protein